MRHLIIQSIHIILIMGYIIIIGLSEILFTITVYTTIQRFSFCFFKEGCIKQHKSDRKDIYNFD